MLTDPEPHNVRLTSRRNRRRTLQAVAAAAGTLLLLRAAGGRGIPLALAQEDDEDDDDTGRGRGRGGEGDRDNRGPGNADGDDDAEDVVEVPTGSIEIRIVSDDPGGFVPSELTVDAGQSVTFVNAHSDEHTATGSGFDTGVIPEGGTASVVLDTPGTFAYACQIHPEMTGTIHVRGENGIVPQQTSEEIPSDAAVRIVNLAFDPAELTVATGSTVAWSNDDSVPHTVTSIDGAFDSGIFDPGMRFSWTYDQPGTFPYQCQLHPQMQGTVIVDGEATDAATAETEAPDQVGESRPQDDADTRPAGIWVAQLIPDSAAMIDPHQAIFTFHEDGMVFVSFSPLGDPGDSTFALGAGHGAWNATSGRIDIALVTLTEDESQRYAGAISMALQVEVDENADVLDGTFTFAATSAEGDGLGEGTGTLRGSRFVTN